MNKIPKDGKSYFVDFGEEKAILRWNKEKKLFEAIQAYPECLIGTPKSVEEYKPQ